MRLDNNSSLNGKKELCKNLINLFFFRYDGYWDDFLPTNGTFYFEDEEEEKKRVRVFGIDGNMNVIKKIEPNNISEMAVKGPVTLEFLNGVVYYGDINQEMEISGLGILITPKNSPPPRVQYNQNQNPGEQQPEPKVEEIKVQDVLNTSLKNLSQEGKYLTKVALFFSNVIEFEFLFENDDQTIQKFIQETPSDYFKDSKDYLEMNEDFKENPWFKFKNSVKTRETNFDEFK